MHPAIQALRYWSCSALASCHGYLDTRSVAHQIAAAYSYSIDAGDMHETGHTDVHPPGSAEMSERSEAASAYNVPMLWAAEMTWHHDMHIQNLLARCRKTEALKHLLQ